MARQTARQSKASDTSSAMSTSRHSRASLHSSAPPGWRFQMPGLPPRMEAASLRLARSIQIHRAAHAKVPWYVPSLELDVSKVRGRPGTLERRRQFHGRLHRRVVGRRPSPNGCRLCDRSTVNDFVGRVYHRSRNGRNCRNGRNGRNGRRTRRRSNRTL